MLGCHARGAVAPTIGVKDGSRGYANTDDPPIPMSDTADLHEAVAELQDRLGETYDREGRPELARGARERAANARRRAASARAQQRNERSTPDTPRDRRP